MRGHDNILEEKEGRGVGRREVSEGVYIAVLLRRVVFFVSSRNLYLSSKSFTFSIN